MRVDGLNKNCCGCGACQQICSKDSIVMQMDAEGFLYPIVDTERCVGCGLCENVCPIVFSKATPQRDIPKVYAAFAKHDAIRLDSSSGGIFSLVAEWVLEQGGVVFGAAFAEDFSVHHIKIESKQDIHKLRGSKYVQSRTESTYNEAKNMLEQGRLVLYSGVGCQIAGLKAFLRKEYDSLFTVDVLCHGAPSPKIWNAYLRNCETKTESKLKQVSFRNKNAGWHNYQTQLCFQNGNLISQAHQEDSYIRLFLSEICLRPSCHSCGFREGRSGADITLGDAWGIENWMPEMDDDRGTSVVFVNSRKGQKLWDGIQTQVTAKCADLDTVVKHNTVYRSSVKPHPNRAKFFKALNKGTQLEELVWLTRRPIWEKALSFGKNCFKKLLGV